MNWNEIKRIAEEKGFKFIRHGKKHDIYYNYETGTMIQNGTGHKKSEKV